MNKLIQEAIEFEQQGKEQLSEEYYYKALQDFPNDADVLYYGGIFLFNKTQYDLALDSWIEFYNNCQRGDSRKNEVLDQIFNAYYYPSKEDFENIYQANINSLHSYKQNYMEPFRQYAELTNICIPRSDSEYYIFNKTAKKFLGPISVNQNRKSKYQFTAGDILLLAGCYNTIDLAELEQQTQDQSLINGAKAPIYVVWNPGGMIEAMFQINDFQFLFESGRWVFFSGCIDNDKFAAFFEDSQAVLPTQVIGTDNFERNKIVVVVNSMLEKRQLMYEKYISSINQTAEKYTKEFYKELFKDGFEKIRLLLYTSRFTQVVQYSTRDFMRACQQVGIECEILIEDSDIHRAGNFALAKKIVEYRPTVIFRINYFSDDFPPIHNNIMFITWLQDPAMQILSTTSAQNFSWSHFAMAMSSKWLDSMKNTGYDHTRLKLQTYVVNSELFSSCSYSEEEYNHYVADISLPGSYANLTESLHDIILDFVGDGKYDLNLEMSVKLLLTAVYDRIQAKIKNEEIIASYEQIKVIINEEADKISLKLNDDMIESIEKIFFERVVYYAMRQVVLEWVVKGGYDIKLWGRKWDQDPIFAPYFRGLITHGEELAKMYSCSKIVFGQFAYGTIHYRVWESLACGALCMVRYLPPEEDYMDIREILTENEDFVFFHNQQDLMEKLDYYLSHEEERKRIVESGRKKMMESGTYLSAAKGIFSYIREYAEKYY